MNRCLNFEFWNWNQLNQYGRGNEELLQILKNFRPCDTLLFPINNTRVEDDQDRHCYWLSLWNRI